MKILFGGTFDPIHKGHVQLALHINEEFNHPVSLLPLSGIPTYKAKPIATLKNRLEMLRLIENKYPSKIDIDYNEIKETSYSPTYLTLRRLRTIYGSFLPIYFIIGGDSLLSLNTWDNWQELISLTNFIVALRPDYCLDTMDSKIKALVEKQQANEYNIEKPAGQVIITNFTPMAISSTEIRKKCLQQVNINNLVEPEIAEYIHKNNLYKGS